MNTLAGVFQGLGTGGGAQPPQASPGAAPGMGGPPTTPMAPMGGWRPPQNTQQLGQDFQGMVGDWRSGLTNWLSNLRGAQGGNVAARNQLLSGFNNMGGQNWGL